jgi:hypothetical protein
MISHARYLASSPHAQFIIPGTVDLLLLYELIDGLAAFLYGLFRGDVSESLLVDIGYHDLAARALGQVPLARSQVLDRPARAWLSSATCFPVFRTLVSVLGISFPLISYSHWTLH